MANVLLKAQDTVPIDRIQQREPELLVDELEMLQVLEQRTWDSGIVLPLTQGDDFRPLEFELLVPISDGLIKFAEPIEGAYQLVFFFD